MSGGAHRFERRVDGFRIDHDELHAEVHRPLAVCFSMGSIREDPRDHAPPVAAAVSSTRGGGAPERHVPGSPATDTLRAIRSCTSAISSRRL